MTKYTDDDEPKGQLVDRHGQIDDADAAIQLLRASAVLELLQEARKDRVSVPAYRRVLKALRTLGIEDRVAVSQVMYRLDYCMSDGQLYSWLAGKLAEKTRDKRKN